ncbi:MAG: hypothetical protein GXP32_07000, partial [Kiritimatiellaeota bacterium]|nr:hypothetical protein [Kiritimatiellota bacterium]
RLEPVESSLDFSVLLVNPRFPVSAAWTYANLKRTPGIEEKSAETAKLAVLAALRSGDPAKLPETIHNDLAPALLLKFPLLRILLDALGDATLPPLSRGITGSGPTLFAVFADDNSTNAAAAKLADEYGDSLDILLA